MTQEQELQLVERAKEDSQAFGELYEYYFPKVYAFVAAKLNHQHNTEDVVSTIFMKILENLPNYENRGLPFGAWVFRITRNALYDFYGHNNKQKTTDIDEVIGMQEDEEKTSPAKKAQKKEVDDKVKEVLRNLPEREASVVQLKFFSGLNNKEIASALQLTESNVGIILFRVLRKLKPELVQLIN